MASLEEVRRLALALPGTQEVEHFRAPSFKAGKKIFAVLREPGKVTLGLDPDDQQNLVAARPGVIEPVGGGTRGPLTTEIQAIFEDALHGRSKRYADWLDKVPAAVS